MPSPPQYFGHDVGINKYNPFDYEQIQNIVMNKLSAEKVDSFVKEHVTIIDVRSKEDIKQGLIEGAVTVDFNGPFATWLGTVFNPKGRFVVYGKV